MSIEVWGEMPKAQDVPQTVDEAIAAAIAAHDADPEAHLGEDGSLQSHKASEIIDHLAASIIADKVRPDNILASALDGFLTALVDIAFIFDFTDFLQTVVGSGSTVRGLMSNVVSSGASAASSALTYVVCGGIPGGVSKFRFDFRNYFDEDFSTGDKIYIKVQQVGQTANVGTGATKDVGFEIEGTDDGIFKLRGFVNRFGTVSYTAYIEDIEATYSHKLSFLVRPGSTYKDIDFFFDDVLLETIENKDLSPFGQTVSFVHAVVNSGTGNATNRITSMSYKLGEWD